MADVNPYKSDIYVDMMQYETERDIERVKKRLAQEYKQAEKELKRTWKQYTQRFAEQDKEKAKQVKSGALSQDDYIAWRKNKILQSDTLKQQADRMAEYMAHADQQSADIVNNMRYGVYAKNYNYARYEIEKNLHIDTTFTLFDQKTVERLAKDNPKLLPTMKPDKIKGKKWSKRKINNAISQGILQGKPLTEVAKNLEQVVGMGWNSAVRNARTAMTGAQNGGRVASYKDAKRLGIDLRKQWVATLDERTRTSHGALDGEKADIDAKFPNGLMYPADPEGKPAEVYNCRCTLIADLIDYPRDNFQRLDNIDGVPIDYVPYNQWAMTKQQAKTTDQDWAQRILDIKNNPALSTEEKIRQAGKIMADEMNGSYLDDLAKEQAWLEKEAGELDRLTKDMTGDNVEEVGRRYEAFRQKRNEFNAKNVWSNHVDAFSKRLGEVRTLGYDDAKVIRAHLNNSRSPMRKEIEYAYSHYPRDWVEKSVSRGVLRVKTSGRGYYNDYWGEIAISNWSVTHKKECAFHELGHRFEYANSPIRQTEQEFYARRTKGEDLQWLGRGYARTEKTRRDKFVEPYMGKDYGGQAYELVSMGFQYAYTEPLQLYKDRDMQEWIYGILCIL